jgi:hypothetical protein
VAQQGHSLRAEDDGHFRQVALLNGTIARGAADPVDKRLGGEPLHHAPPPLSGGHDVSVFCPVVCTTANVQRASALCGSSALPRQQFAD